MKRLFSIFNALLLLMVLTVSEGFAANVQINRGVEKEGALPYAGEYGGIKTRMLFKADELTSAGVLAGELRGLSLKITNEETIQNVPLENFRVRITNYTGDLLLTNQPLPEQNWTVCYGGTNPPISYNPKTGSKPWKKIDFTTPFVWNGQSNIVIEIAWTNNVSRVIPQNNKGIRIESEYTGFDWGNNPETGEWWGIGMVMYTLAEEPVASLDGFPTWWEISSNRPNIKLDCQNYKPTIMLIPHPELNFDFIDLNRISETKSFQVNFFGATPENGNLIVTPAENAYVSANGTDFVTHPNSLSIPYAQGIGEEIKIFAKIKGKAVADPEFTTPVNIRAGDLSKTISLKANCGTTPFPLYCASAPRDMGSSAIMKVTLKQLDNVLLENGTVLDKTTSLEDNEINNEGYKSYIETVPAPTLKAGEEYSLTIDRATKTTELGDGNVYVYIDANRDGVLSNNEIVVAGKMGIGVSKVNVDFTMPQGVVVAGDSKVLMRVILSAFSINSACDNYWTGETEDYAVSLAPAVAATVSAIEPLKTGNDSYRPTERNKLIAGLKVQINGSDNRPAVSKIKFTNPGTVTSNDIKDIKLWYLGKGLVLDTATNQPIATLATIAPGENTIEVTTEPGKELSILPSGKNYFAITCNVSQNATPGKIIDFNTVAVEFKKKDNTVINFPVTNGNPDDKHIIKNPLSGTIYVGGNPTGSSLNYYENLKLAADELRLLGGKGNIEFAIAGDNAIPDSESVVFAPFETYNTKAKITIYPKDAPRVIKGKFTDKSAVAPLITFVKIDNFVIDGRVNKQGEEVGLKIVNEGAEGITASLAIVGDDTKVLKDVVIRNTEFTGKGRSLLLSMGVISFDAKLEEARIQNNLFNGYSTGLYVGGKSKSTKYLTKSTIENNTFGSKEAALALSLSGIRLLGSSETKIINNTFNNITGAFIARAVNGILVDNSNSDLEIKNNYFDNITSALNSRVSAIRVISHSVSDGIIADNIVNRIICNGGGHESNVNLGFDIIDANGLKIYHNAVYLEGNRSELPDAPDNALPVSTYSAALYVGKNAIEVDARNNIFVNRLRHNEDNPTAKCLSVVVDNPASFFNIDYNAYYSGGTNPIMGFCVDDKASLSAWIATVDGDRHSVYSDIKFIKKDGVKFGTLDGKAAMDDRLYVPTIKDYSGTTDIHGNPRGTIKTNMGVDEVVPTFEFTQLLPDEIDRKCAPHQETLAVAVRVNGFSDGIEREINGTPNFKYQWTRNGVNIPNIREKTVVVPAEPDAEDQSPVTKVVADTVNSREHIAKFEVSNIAEPDNFAVNVSFFDITKQSNVCTIKAEGTIRITKQPEETSVLCTDSGVNRISVGAIGTISGYQWQKLINNTWTNLDDDTQNFLDITLTNEKYGTGKYRVIIYDGDYDCNQGQIVSGVCTLSEVNPVSDVNLVSEVYDLSEEIVLCEGKTLDIKLDRDPTTGIKGDIYGYRWEEYSNGKWIEADLEMRPYLSENGIFTEYTTPEQSGKYRLVVVGSDLCNTKEAISNVITLKVKPFVNITEQPKPGVFCKDKSIVLSVKSQGTEPKYQWYKDGVKIDTLDNETANKARFVIDTAKFEDAGYYSVIITVEDCLEDGGDKLYSAPASVIVMNATEITKQPEDITVLRGKTTKLIVESNAIGLAPDYIADYQWYKYYVLNGLPISERLEDNDKYSGAKANILMISDVEDIDVLNVKYFVRIKGACGNYIDSDTIKVTISDFAFTKLLENKNVCIDDTVKLSVKAETVFQNENVTYEWHFVSEGKDILLDGNGEEITLIANPAVTGQYYALAKLDNMGTVIKSNIAKIKVGVKPVITNELKEANATVNELFTLNVEVAGPDIQYKWFRDGREISNAVSASLTMSESKPGTYKYKVVVSNICGAETSEAIVTIAQAMSRVEEEVETGFTVSNIVPNPVVSNEAKFSVSSELGGKAEISIVDAAGRAKNFFSGNITGSKNFTINTSKYASGAYFIVITIDGKKITRRFVVEK